MVYLCSCFITYRSPPWNHHTRWRRKRRMPCTTPWSYSPATTASHWNRWASVCVQLIHFPYLYYLISFSYHITVQLWFSSIMCKLHLFPLSQDMCVVCGSFGLGAEGRLLACAQCGQCYHPFCVGIKVRPPSLTVAEPLWGLPEDWYYIRTGNIGTPVMIVLRVNRLLISNPLNCVA